MSAQVRSNVPPRVHPDSVLATHRIAHLATHSIPQAHAHSTLRKASRRCDNIMRVRVYALLGNKCLNPFASKICALFNLHYGEILN